MVALSMEADQNLFHCSIFSRKFSISINGVFSKRVFFVYLLSFRIYVGYLKIFFQYAAKNSQNLFI